MQICGYEEEDSKAHIIGKGVVQNVASEMLHSRVINQAYVSLTITKSYQNNYYLFSLHKIDPPITAIGMAPNYFVLWPINWLRLYEAPQGYTKLVDEYCFETYNCMEFCNIVASSEF